jgi:hypothetical protein
MHSGTRFGARLATIVGLVAVMLVTCGAVAWGADAAGDYRSAASGNWNAIATWQRYDGTNWVAAAATPTSADGVITIRNGHVVTISATVAYDQVVVDAGGQVTVPSSVASTLANGTGTDLTINGTWLNSGGTWTTTSTSWTVGATGTFIHNTTSGISTPLNSATLDPASTFIYRGSSTLQTAVSLSGRTYGNLTFESTSGTWTTTATSGATATGVNGNFTIGSGVTLTQGYTGVLTVAGSYTVNGAITYGTGTQVTTFTGSGKTISGSGTIAFETLNINAGASITCNNAVTELAGFTATVANGATLATAATFTNSGTMNVNGTFQINTGGWATGTNFVYATYGSALAFANTGSSYDVKDGAYWPSANGPRDVTVSGSGGITMTLARSVSGVFQTAAGVTNGGNLTFSNSCQINAGGYFVGSPVYSGGWLRYNTPGGFSVGPEWTPSGAGPGGTRAAGSGQPFSVEIHAGVLTLDSNPRVVPGDLDIFSTGGLTLTAGGDLAVGGGWDRVAGSTFTHNNVGVWFIGSGTQEISGNLFASNVETFGYLLLKNTGMVILATDVTVTGATGDALQILVPGSPLNLVGHTLTMSGGGALKVNGGACQIFSPYAAKLVFSAPTNVNPMSGGSLVLGPTITAELTNGVAFNSTTLNGTLQLDAGGYVNTTPPTYGSASTLKYNSGGTYGRSVEWSATSNPGYPANVRISSSTTLDLGANGGAAVTRAMSGNLTIDSGSKLGMNESGNVMTGNLIVPGNVTVPGTLELGMGSLTSEAGSIQVGGNFDFTGGTFLIGPSSRYCARATFNGTGTQTVSATGELGFPSIFIDKASGIVQLACDARINAWIATGLGMEHGDLDLNGHALNVTRGEAYVLANNGLTRSSPRPGRAPSSSIRAVWVHTGTGRWSSARE